jgi:hypothetical protein
MNMPGFTAEAALTRSGKHCAMMTRPSNGQHCGRLLPVLQRTRPLTSGTDFVPLGIEGRD